MQQLPSPLAALAAWPQFVCWFAQPIPDKPGKFNKFPCHWQTGAVCDAQDPANWTTFDVALAMAAAHDRGHGGGVGFVFTQADPFFFADIDGCAQPDGTWSPLALSILARFPGACVEVSHSGRGLHVIGQGTPVPHAKKNTPLNLELYTEGRFVALTGNGALGDAGTDHTAALVQYIADFFPPAVAGEAGAGWTTQPVPEWAGPTDDDDLIAKALASGQRNAAAAFGASDTVTFKHLWEGDVGNMGRSEADMALANHLAFWTGKDCERMERIMRRSALVRDKWDSPRPRGTYLKETIERACAFINTVAQGRPATPVQLAEVVPQEQMQAAAVLGNRQLRAPNSEYMGAYQQIEHFDGCTYLTRRNEVFSLPRNEVLTKASFDVVYGGHLFTLDPQNAKPTDSAWEAFTKSRVYQPVMATDLCFRPEVTSGALIQDGHRVMVNSYVPYEPHAIEGDPAPFLGLLAKMLPDPMDQAKLLAWMARVAQSPGQKLQWWPVIQGVQGNGKTTIANVMAHLSGEDYTHQVNVAAMAKTEGQFNEWLFRKTLVILEEIKVADRRGFLEIMKPIVTADRIPLEGKGKAQTTGDNRANGVILTNHQDGMPVDDAERRYGMFFCAQQHPADLERDGMTAAYFLDLQHWWRGTGAYETHGPNYGLAIMARYLRTMAIAADLDPANHTRAPQTSSTATAVAASLGRLEQEILEAIDEGRPGFAGGWVSSRYLDALIDQMRSGIPRSKRRGVMQSLGYDWHPALRDGRTNDMVMPDSAKPKLYVRNGHLALNITDPKAVAAAYSKAQAPEGATSAAVAFGAGKA